MNANRDCMNASTAKSCATSIGTKTKMFFSHWCGRSTRRYATGGARGPGRCSTLCATAFTRAFNLGDALHRNGFDAFSHTGRSAVESPMYANRPAPNFSARKVAFRVPFKLDVPEVP